MGIDLAAACVDACITRFDGAAHARFLKNDGLSLEDADDTFDLVFSFDSLVHAEIDVFKRYIPQLIEKLSSDGVAFLHHSNLAAMKSSVGVETHSRASTVSAKNIADLVSQSGGNVVVQEIINWGATDALDCLTTFGRADIVTSDPVCLVNSQFMQEAEIIRLYQSHYAFSKTVQTLSSGGLIDC